MFRKLVSAFARSGELSVNCGSSFVIRCARLHSSVRLRRISSLIDSTCIISSIFFGRANRGLLVEARAPEEAGASLATATERTSAPALAAMQPTKGAIWPEGEGRFGAVEMEEAVLITAI
jgi:hypothetical protein